MKLFQIWNAVKAWQKVSGLDKSPKLALKLFLYGKKAAPLLEFCEQQRQECVYEVSGVEPGTPVNIDPGTEQFVTFLAKFNERIAGDADLEVLDMTLADLIDGLGAEGNVISEDELELLEPFFKASV